MQILQFAAPTVLAGKTAVLASIHAEWNEKIFIGEKGVEVRKGRPWLSAPFRALVYSTKPKPGTMGLCIEARAEKKHLGRVYPRNYDTAAQICWRRKDWVRLAYLGAKAL